MIKRNWIPIKGGMQISFIAIMAIFAVCNISWAIGTISFNEPGIDARTDILNESGTAIPSADLENGSVKVETSIAHELKDNNYPRKYLFNSSDNSITFRVWNGTPRTRGVFFGSTSSGYKVNATQPSYAPADLLSTGTLADGTAQVPDYWVVGALTTNTKYDNPYTPSVNYPTESYVRVRGTNDITLSFSISAAYNATQNGITIPATNYKWKVWNATSESEPGDSNWTGGTLNFTTREVHPGETYKFRVKAINDYFPTEGSAYSDPPFEYTLLNIGGGVISGGGGVFRGVLNKSEADKLVVNTIYLPTLTSSGLKASTLAAEINRQGGQVTSIAKWDYDHAVTALFDDSGALTSGDFDLTAGTCYQVYTKKQCSITLL